MQEISEITVNQRRRSDEAFSAEEEKSVKQKILIEQLRLMENGLRISVPLNFLCATIVFLGFYQVNQSYLTWGWFCAVVLITLVRTGLFLWYRISPLWYRWHLNLFIIATCVSGALWGIADSLLMPADNFFLQMIIIVIVTGITAGGLQTLQASLIANISLLLLVILPLTAWFFLQPHIAYTLIGIVTLIYLFSMLLLSWRGYQLITEILKLRFENIILLRHMAEANKNLTEINNSLQESENRFHSSFDYAAVGMGLVALEGSWIKVNKSLCQMVGYTEEELLRLDFRKITFPDDLAKEMEYSQALLDGKIVSYQMEKRYIRKDNTVTWVLMSVALVRDIDGRPLYYIGQVQNIDAQKTAEEFLKNMAYHDPLTGIANRKKLEISYNLALKYAQRHSGKVAIYFLDIDYYKRINDNFGHEIGDGLLKLVAKRLQSTIRSTDTVARLGGDEFIVVGTEFSTTNDIITTAKKLREIIAEPMIIKDHEIFISASIGISIYPKDGLDLEGLIKNADKALYQVKAEGRNNFKLYTPSMG